LLVLGSLFSFLLSRRAFFSFGGSFLHGGLLG
jgi:hypothetical protein